MASSLYDIGRRGFLTEVTVGAYVGQIDWLADNFRAVLLDITYDFDTTGSTDTSLANISTSVVADAEITGKGATATGIATADSTVFPSVTGDEVISVVIYRDHNISDADNALVAYLDDSITGLPVTPNGGDITILWNGGTGEIFRL